MWKDEVRTNMSMQWQFRPLDRGAMDAAQARLDDLIKPVGSLGLLEKWVVRLAGIQGTARPKIGRKAHLVFAADNGIWEEGIGTVPYQVTAAQCENMVKGLTAINVLCRQAGAEVRVVDVGVRGDVPGVRACKVRPGTANMARGPAMTRPQAETALQVGFDQAVEAAGEGVQLLGVGEMGICNTSTSAAMLSVFAGVPVEQVTGRGVGLDEDLFARKKAAIARAIQINQPDPEDPLDVLAKVGGLDIAAMTGTYLGAAACGLPVIVDGFIAMVAAITAQRLAPEAGQAFFLSHASAEPGVALAAQMLGQPPLQLGMRLGEGTGCPLLMGLMGAALACYEQMGTFSQGNIDAENIVEFRD